MKTWSFFDRESGLFTGAKFSGSDIALAANTPTGCDAFEGDFDHLSQRVNLRTLVVEDWRPPAPVDTEMTRHEWHEHSRRWIAVPTLSALKARAKQGVLKEIERIEAGQARALREIAIAPERLLGMARLKQIEQRIQVLRARLALIDEAPDAQALTDLTENRFES